MAYKTIIIGLGKTGLSCAHFLQAKGETFSVMDNRDNPPCYAQFKSDFPDVPVILGEFDEIVLRDFDRLIISPGVALSEPAVSKASTRGAIVIGDIELFAQNANAPIIAITGSNGKTTVTTLLGEMASQAGFNIKLGGNIGRPALDLLNQQITEPEKVDYYILELSSFQLETTNSLDAQAAVVLNISPDHMDRYNNLDDYKDSKSRIFNGSGVMVGNRDDELVMELLSKIVNTGTNRRIITFGSGEPKADEYGIRIEGDHRYLAFGEKNLLAVDEMHIAGQHNYANALAAMALANVMGISDADMILSLRNFSGLQHRTQWIASKAGVNWYNDSKGTNVGATVAAIDGLPGNKILIAGGVGKGADFSPLRDALLNGKVRIVILFGRDAGLIGEKIQQVVKVEYASDIKIAVQLANRYAELGDSVLFSPACASFDMFKNFEARGEAFTAAVKEIQK